MRIDVFSRRHATLAFVFSLLALSLAAIGAGAEESSLYPNFGPRLGYSTIKYDYEIDEWWLIDNNPFLPNFHDVHYELEELGLFYDSLWYRAALSAGLKISSWTKDTYIDEDAWTFIHPSKRIYGSFDLEALAKLPLGYVLSGFEEGDLPFEFWLGAGFAAHFVASYDNDDDGQSEIDAATKTLDALNDVFFVLGLGFDLGFSPGLILHAYAQWGLCLTAQPDSKTSYLADVQLFEADSFKLGVELGVKPEGLSRLARGLLPSGGSLDDFLEEIHACFYPAAGIRAINYSSRRDFDVLGRADVGRAADPIRMSITNWSLEVGGGLDTDWLLAQCCLGFGPLEGISYVAKQGLEKREASLALKVPYTWADLLILAQLTFGTSDFVIKPGLGLSFSHAFAWDIDGDGADDVAAASSYSPALDDIYLVTGFSCGLRLGSCRLRPRLLLGLNLSPNPDVSDEYESLGEAVDRYSGFYLDLGLSLMLGAD